MATKKVKLVTPVNVDQIAEQFDLDDDEFQEAIGTYAVADFGNSRTCEYLSQEVLDDRYTFVGLIVNGWSEYKTKE